MTATLPAPVGDELLDHPDADPSVVRESLRHIARANWWFGGWWAVRRGLATLLADRPRSPVTVVDIGCGSADLLCRAVRWASRRGIRLVPIGLERHRAAAALAQQAVPTLLAAAPDLPFRDRSVDLVIASQLLHHFAPETIVAICRAADRLARRGVIVADLRRSAVAAAGFRIGSRLLRFDPVTRADGVTSVRRGFSEGELQDLTQRAGVRARVVRSPGFRLVATWTTGAA